ncbi:MAG: DUF1566 domain-containing protein, partial [Treponema sp.]|nr:DUF1566 domain-containing protein [Treponema sp.]
TAELATHDHETPSYGSGLHLAARACADYSVTNGTTYDDWFLPSKDELNLMYTNLQAQGLGGFSNTYYWSSSESSSNNALGHYFDYGLQYGTAKINARSVRAVRAF